MTDKETPCTHIPTTSRVLTSRPLTAHFYRLQSDDRGVWGTFALAGPEEVDRAVKAASAAYRTGPWGKLSPTRRGRLLMNGARSLPKHADRIATIETEQNGKLSPRCARRRGLRRTGSITSAASPTRSKARDPARTAEHR